MLDEPCLSAVSQGALAPEDWDAMIVVYASLVDSYVQASEMVYGSAEQIERLEEVFSIGEALIETISAVCHW